MAKPAAEWIRRKYDFTSEVFDIIIGGRSAIDSTQGFQIANPEDADRFIRSYGFDLENPIERAEAIGNFHESLNFIRKYFLQPENPEGLKLEIPRKILELTDVRELFLMASMSFSGQQDDRPGQFIKNWACSILKVMHTVAHIDQDLRTSYFADIQQQIFDRFYKFIHRDEGGRDEDGPGGKSQLYLGERSDDPMRVDLLRFESKPKKTRDSTLIKLLHKPENVAEELFDRVGLRFITHTRLDALRVIKFLRDRMIVMPPNIKPSRSRNTLVDLDLFRARLAELTRKIELDPGTPESEKAFNQALEDAAQYPPGIKDNPFTSEFYRAIQFTARQLIKLRNPLYDDLKELKAQSRAKAPHEEIQKVIEKLDLKYLPREIRFFYPYEVQVMDDASAEENERGRSAHSEYKRAQLNMAMKRVMGNLADAAR